MVKNTIETYSGWTIYNTEIESGEVEGLLGIKRGTLNQDTLQQVIDWVDIDDEVINDYVKQEIEDYQEEIIDELGLEENE